MKSNMHRRFVVEVLIVISLVVIGVALYTLSEVFQFIRDPLFGLMDTGTVLDPTLAHILARLAAVLAVCQLVYATALRAIDDCVGRPDRLLVLLMVGYTMIKGFISGGAAEDSMTEGFRRVLVDTVGSNRIGFEVKQPDSGKVVDFLPNGPADSTGIVAA